MEVLSSGTSFRRSALLYCGFLSMKKPINKVINARRRAKEFTLEEWRELYSDTFNAVRDDIWKNIQGKGVVTTITPYNPYLKLAHERDDVSQVMELIFIGFFRRFVDGSDSYEFPPTPGAFYKNCYFKCLEIFTQVSRGGPVRVYSTRHDQIVDERNCMSYDFDEDRECRLEAEKECNVCAYVENYIGISMDDQLGTEFSLWWMGYEYTEISHLLLLAGVKGTSRATIQRRMNQAFNSVQEFYSLNRPEIKKIRNFCLDLDRKRSS